MKWKDYIIYSILLLIFILLIIPRYLFIEPFDTSSDLYRKNINEIEYYKEIYGDSLQDFEKTLLHMNRCIKIPFEEMENFTNNIVLNATFPILSKKFTIDSYSDIEAYILNSLQSFNKKTEKIHGPIYVLISQAPFIQVINNNCDAKSVFIQFNYDNDIFNNKSKLVTFDKNITTECNDVIKEKQSQKMSVIVYILLPTYNKNGNFVYRSWENIKCNMKDLLKYRNKDKYCFMECVNSTIPCGCMSQDEPYLSRCLGDNSTFNNSHYTYANLFLLNTKYVNRILKKDLISEEQVSIYPYDNDTSYCTTNEPIMELNKIFTLNELKPSSKNILKHLQTNRCLQDGDKIPIGKCNSMNSKFLWIIEGSSDNNFYLKNAYTNKYLYDFINKGITYIATSSISKTLFNYEDYQITYDNKRKYIDIDNDIIKAYDFMINEKSKIINLTIDSIMNYGYIYIQLPNNGYLQYYNSKLSFNSTPNEYQKWIFEKTPNLNCYKIRHYKSGNYLTTLYIKKNKTYIIKMLSSSFNNNITTWDISNNNIKIKDKSNYLTYSSPSVIIGKTGFTWNFKSYSNIEKKWVIEKISD